MTSTWGTSRRSAIDLVDAALNQRPVTVYDTLADGSRVVNDTDTAAARSWGGADAAKTDPALPAGTKPLAEFVKALPAELTIGLEVPMVSKARAGLGLREALAPAVAAARRLLG